MRTHISVWKALVLALALAISMLAAQPAPATQDTPPFDFSMVPAGGWPLCDIVPAIPCPPAGQEPWLFSVYTTAGPEVVAFQVVLSFLPKDGKDGDPLQTVTFAFVRDDRRYGANADGTPLVYTAHVEALGRIQPKTLKVNALRVSFAKAAF